MLFLSLVTRKHKIFQGCAVAKPNRCTYYFEIDEDCQDGLLTWKKGVYASEGYTGGYFVGWQTRALWASKRVWRQGPKGGVKIVSRGHIFDYGYVTKDEKRMKEFIWVKLKAQPVK